MLIDQVEKVFFFNEIYLGTLQGFAGNRMAVHIIEAVFFDKFPGVDNSEDLLLAQAEGLNQFYLPGAENIDAVAGFALVEDRLMFIIDKEFLGLEEVLNRFASQIAQIAQAFHDAIAAILDKQTIFHHTIMSRLPVPSKSKNLAIL